MNKKPAAIDLNNNLNPTRIRQTKQNFVNLTSWHYGAAAGLTGGLLSVLIGLSLIAQTWSGGIGAALNKSSQTSGIWLIMATIPAMMFGAFCLDKIQPSVRK